jgi:hypothetical protein
MDYTNTLIVHCTAEWISSSDLWRFYIVVEDKHVLAIWVWFRKTSLIMDIGICRRVR